MTVVVQHEELLQLLQHHLCPLVHKALSDRPAFPLSLRSTRVVFLLLKQFSSELSTEAEVFLMLLIKIIGSDGGRSGSRWRTSWTAAAVDARSGNGDHARVSRAYPLNEGHVV